MAQFDFGIIDPDTKSGPALADDLMDMRDALHTSHLGPARPAYVKPGMIWIQDVSASRWDLFLAVTPAADVKIGEFNPTTASWSLVCADGTFSQVPTGPSVDPENDDDLARKRYVDTKVAGYFPQGTSTLFVQSTAPPGWTKSTAHDNKALRVVTGSAGSGGSIAFTAAFSAERAITGAVQNMTLTIDQIPWHYHDVFGQVVDGAGGGGTADPVGTPGNRFRGTWTAGQGGSQPHNHALAINPIDLSVAYVDVIIATRDAV